jgi:hypothetical protein
MGLDSDMYMGTVIVFKFKDIRKHTIK